MLQSGAESLKTSSYGKLAFEERSHTTHTLPSLNGLACCPRVLSQLVLHPGAAFHPFSDSLQRGLPSIYPPRLELFVQVRDGIGGGPGTQAETHWQLNHAKT